MLNETDWPYITRSHCVLVIGTQSDRKKFELADPFMHYRHPKQSMFYAKSASIIHNGISINKGGYIY